MCGFQNPYRNSPEGILHVKKSYSNSLSPRRSPIASIRKVESFRFHWK
eukprot:UN04308